MFSKLLTEGIFVELTLDQSCSVFLSFSQILPVTKPRGRCEPEKEHRVIRLAN